jgi:hypothetical protein
MSVTTSFYNSFLEDILEGTIDLDTDSIYACLLDSGYSLDIDAHVDLGDVTGSECSGTGYTASGKALSNVSATKDTTNDLAYLDADDVSWTGATISARYMVLYKKAATPADSKLIECIDFGESKAVTSGTLSASFATGGIFTLSATA